MTGQTTGTINGAVLQPEPPDLTKKAVKMARRVQQVAIEPGEYHFTLIVLSDGRWQLRPPARVEELGQ